jgi:hypothetical protein
MITFPLPARQFPGLKKLAQARKISHGFETPRCLTGFHNDRQETPDE